MQQEQKVIISMASSLNCVSNFRTCWATKCIHIITVSSWKYPPVIHSAIMQCVTNTSFVCVKTASWWSRGPLALSLFLIHLLLSSSSGIVLLNYFVAQGLGLTTLLGVQRGRRYAGASPVQMLGWDLQLQDSAAAPLANGNSRAMVWAPDLPAKQDAKFPWPALHLKVYIQILRKYIDLTPIIC